MNATLLAAALLIGCLLAVQASVNLQLNKAVGTPYGASTLQLGVATALLGLLTVVTGSLGAFGNLPDVEWWHLLGGLASPLYITSGILLFPRLGALAAVGLFVTGQMFASLALDLSGMFGLERKGLSPGIVLGAAAVVAGIIVIIKGQRASAPSGVTMSGGRRTGWIALGVVAGGVLPVQGAVNAKLRDGLDAPVAVAAFSFAVATLTIVAELSGDLDAAEQRHREAYLLAKDAGHSGAAARAVALEGLACVAAARDDGWSAATLLSMAARWRTDAHLIPISDMKPSRSALIWRRNTADPRLSAFIALTCETLGVNTDARQLPTRASVGQNACRSEPAVRFHQARAVTPVAHRTGGVRYSIRRPLARHRFTVLLTLIPRCPLIRSGSGPKPSRLRR